jgi:hypothetical protein
MYFYTENGVYRKSNHWGRVANCRWKLITNTAYKNQQIVIAFVNWIDFYPINSAEKIFFIDVNFEEKTAKIIAKNEKHDNQLFTFSEAQKRIKQIMLLFKDDKWAKYFDEDITVLRKEIIVKYINSNSTLQLIKANI